MIIFNIKITIIGVYHAIQLKYLSCYLAEFCYRFNQRFQLDCLPFRSR
ncbi:transposase [Candidatus Albibeggiatoa sp. nov. BB20]